jgi:hypothetical protein
MKFECKFRSLFRSADLVSGKRMGNYDISAGNRPENYG